jgi:hypothetical protein
VANALRFCRSCFAVLEDDEEICNACGTRWVEQEPAGDIAQKGHTQPRQVAAREERKKISKSPSLLDSLRHTSLEATPPEVHKIVNGKFSAITIMGLIVFASYFLWQYTIHSQVILDVRRQTLDETFRMLILSQLHAHPTEYYSIADHFFRQIFTSQGPTFSNDFPLMFYVWLLAPTIGDIKWLYFAFALAGTVASYFTIFATTKQRLVAFLSAVWVAYFLEITCYLAYEPWGVSIFLIGLAFFLMNQHVPAAITIGVSTLIYEVFAPFLLFASIYYLVVSIQDRLNIVEIKKSRIMRPLTHHAKKTREAFVWIMATFVVGLLWYLNGFVSTGGRPNLSDAGFQQVLGFKPELFVLLFSGTYFRNPLTIGSFRGVIPIVLLPVVVALVGMTFLDLDKRIIVYASFAFIPLLIPFGIIRVGATVSISTVAERWAVMSIAMVNLFWVAGLYRICKYVYSGYSRIVSEEANTSEAGKGIQELP